jgi:hypothetical protein
MLPNPLKIRVHVYRLPSFEMFSKSCRYLHPLTKRNSRDPALVQKICIDVNWSCCHTYRTVTLVPISNQLAIRPHRRLLNAAVPQLSEWPLTLLSLFPLGKTDLETAEGFWLEASCSTMGFALPSSPCHASSIDPSVDPCL